MNTSEPMHTPKHMGTDPSGSKPADFVPEKTFPPGHIWEGKPRCQAWSHGNDRQCNRMPSKGKTVCRAHGAAGGRPPKHGRSSIPAKVSEAYARMAGDPKLRELNEEIAILGARIQQLLDQLDQLGESDPEAEEKIWKKIRSTMRLEKQLIDSELRRRIETGQMVMVSEVLEMMSRMYVLICKYVPDNRSRRALLDEIRAMVPKQEEAGPRRQK
jgi:hypothetical protein